MNLKEFTATFAFLGLVTHVMANEISIANSSEYLIPVKSGSNAGSDMPPFRLAAWRYTRI